MLCRESNHASFCPLHRDDFFFFCLRVEYKHWWPEEELGEMRGHAAGKLATLGIPSIPQRNTTQDHLDKYPLIVSERYSIFADAGTLGVGTFLLFTMVRTPGSFDPATLDTSLLAQYLKEQLLHMTGGKCDEISNVSVIDTGHVIEQQLHLHNAKTSHKDRKRIPHTSSKSVPVNEADSAFFANRTLPNFQKKSSEGGSAVESSEGGSAVKSSERGYKRYSDGGYKQYYSGEGYRQSSEGGYANPSDGHDERHKRLEPRRDSSPLTPCRHVRPKPVVDGAAAPSDYYVKNFQHGDYVPPPWSFDRLWSFTPRVQNQG